MGDHQLFVNTVREEGQVARGSEDLIPVEGLATQEGVGDRDHLLALEEGEGAKAERGIPAQEVDRQLGRETDADDHLGHKADQGALLAPGRHGDHHVGGALADHEEVVVNLAKISRQPEGLLDLGSALLDRVVHPAPRVGWSVLGARPGGA